MRWSVVLSGAASGRQRAHSAKHALSVVDTSALRPQGEYCQLYMLSRGNRLRFALSALRYGLPRLAIESRCAIPTKSLHCGATGDALCAAVGLAPTFAALEYCSSRLVHAKSSAVRRISAALAAYSPRRAEPGAPPGALAARGARALRRQRACRQWLRSWACAR